MFTGTVPQLMLVAAVCIVFAYETVELVDLLVVIWRARRERR